MCKKKIYNCRQIFKIKKTKITRIPIKIFSKESFLITVKKNNDESRKINFIFFSFQ